MDLQSSVHAFDLAISALLALLNATLCGVFVYAYRRLRKRFFLVLAIASGCFVYANLFPAYLSLRPPTIAVFTAPFMRTLYIAYTIIGPTSSVLWFVGTILFLRAALKSWSSVSDLTNR